MMKVLVILAAIGCASAASSWTDQLKNGVATHQLATTQDLAFSVSAFTSACPGGSMDTCGKLCPSASNPVYTVCMHECGVRCGAGGGASEGWWPASGAAGGSGTG